jgi:tubulin-specific chaperone A
VNAEFGELQKNLKKSTGLTSEAVTSLTDSLAQLDTRTSLKDLLGIATQGGKSGIQGGEQGILKFTAAVDKLAVSLGDDFAGPVEETTDKLIKLSNAFFGTTTDGEELSGNLLSIGNALNVLADSGNASAENLTDFANRVGPLAKSLGLTEGQILGTGAALEELGVNAEIGASAFSNILNQITGNTTKFAQTLGLDVAKFKNQVNTDLFGAFQTVIAKVKELGPENTKTAETLKALGLNSNEVQRAFAALSNGQELLVTRTKQATDALKSQDKVNAEFAASNDTLQGSLDKLGKKFTEIQRSEGIGKLFKTIIDGATTALNAIDKLLSSKLFDASTFIGPAGNIANIYNIITGKAADAEAEAKLAEENQKKRIDTFFELRKEADEKDITMTQAKTDRLFSIKRKEGADLLEQQEILLKLKEKNLLKKNMFMMLKRYQDH